MRRDTGEPVGPTSADDLGGLRTVREYYADKYFPWGGTRAKFGVKGHARPDAILIDIHPHGPLDGIAIGVPMLPSQVFEDAQNGFLAGLDGFAQAHLHTRAVQILLWLANLEVTVARKVVLEEPEPKLERKKTYGVV